ncbi:methyltransferase domain-containing protein [Emcibacteraceae bacterium]|nr:methyltransferase domain-containing protein [Emcibacteraceae bacterium]
MIRKNLKAILMKLGFFTKINWKKRVKKYGVYAAHDSRTPLSKIEEVTAEQNAIYSKVLLDLAFNNNEPLKILDFGAGYGRHFNLLSTFNEGVTNQVDFLDKTIEFHSLALGKGYHEMYAEITDLNCEVYDIVFIHMVFGGLSDQEVQIICKKLKKATKAGGFLFIIETMSDNNPIYNRVWKKREKSFYKTILEDYFSVLEAGSVHEAGDKIVMLLAEKRTFYE